MPKVTYVSHSGQKMTVDVPVGQSVMQAAVANGIEPIVGECGGSCMCATCHVYVSESQVNVLPPMTPSEDAMLDATASERRPNSRLSCQLVMSERMDGLIVHLPETEV
jgi:2Fe-2S ferredoxin